ncbi:ATP-dependent Clp protease proteolytic subunit [Ensifer psoraleae]|uniref:ATP-dependent Clp protease proteolytic subunit n=1 Tax=Sinorhizobium psoraleae TaxID=520838 RepID=UPI0015694676|nr:ATP-dependent Clp protease proteolytic subunit [Sinorhizobium psoraleae]NRP72997.1 ATP-dependent Clp protease proteolytic subunit [Sinorhizobium psoraleae]
MRIDEPFKALMRLDDGVLMRGAFFILLSAAAVFLLIDMRDIAAMNAEVPGFDPMHEPVLPPALTEGMPNPPSVQPASSHEVLRQPMKFELTSGGVLLAEGTIDLGAGARFAREIEARGEYVKTVALNSPGGSVDDALAISKLIREKKLDTKVASKALCASSCPIVFAGGVGRLAEKDAVVGVHQFFNGSKNRSTAEQAMSTAQSTTARVARHFDAMGIGAGLWINALETPPDRLYYLTAKEMADFKLTTEPVATAKKKA